MKLKASNLLNIDWKQCGDTGKNLVKLFATSYTIHSEKNEIIYSMLLKVLSCVKVLQYRSTWVAGKH